MKEICNHNKFEILNKKLENGELSADSINNNNKVIIIK